MPQNALFGLSHVGGGIIVDRDVTTI